MLPLWRIAVVADSERTAVHDELATSIETTLAREGRKNEQIIAAVRAGLLGALCPLEIAFMFTNTGIELQWRIPLFVYFAASAGLWYWLRRGGYHASVPMVVPFFDAAFIVSRLQTAYHFHDIDLLRLEMELATVCAVCAVLILTGAFRLRHRAVWVTTALGIGIYAWFAYQSEVPFLQALTQLALLAAVGAMAVGVTTQVHRAVRSEVARQTLSRFLPATVMDGVHDDPLSLLTRPRSVDATVLISDIRGFTSWAEQRNPIEVLAFLNIVQGTLAEIVRTHDGTVDKFMGDGMLAVFGAPKDLDDHADRAVAAAQEMQRAMERINGDNDVDVHIGIGIHSGELVVGCLGSGVRMEFTVLGDTVNLSSRLESLTKEQGVSVLVSADTVARMKATESLREVGEVSVRGRQEPLTIHTISKV